MKYPKEVMALPELKKMGYPPGILYQAAHAHGSGSFKGGNGGRTAMWYFRTQEFDAWISRLAEDQKR